MKSKLLLGTAALLLSSCSVAGIRKHEPGYKNVQSLERVKGSFSVGRVEATQQGVASRLKSKSMPCRLTTFNAPAGMTFSDYLQSALTDELSAAKKMSASGVPISIRVNQLESDSSGFDKGTWKLDFDYLVGSKRIHVTTATVFESAFVADTACRNTASALTDALAENFRQFYQRLSN